MLLVVLKIYKFENYIFECVRLSTLARFNVKGNKMAMMRRSMVKSDMKVPVAVEMVPRSRVLQTVQVNLTPHCWMTLKLANKHPRLPDLYASMMLGNNSCNK